MTNAFTGKQMGLAVSCALALVVLSGAARAESDPAERALVTDQRDVVVKSGFGLCWHSSFGPPPVSTAECDPNYVPTPIAQAEAPQAATPKPAGGRVTLDADTLFDFDKAVLRPAGKVALDEFSDKLKGVDTEVITVVGHTDRFGTATYNQRLSERRAAAVKAYLVGQGIAANRVQTEGKGKTEPVTKAGECVGAKSAKVIACLQPDRRVDIEVVGSQIVK